MIMNERVISAAERRHISGLVRQLRDVTTDEVVSELLGIDPFEVRQIAEGHDFNHDKYSRVTASLDLQPQELRTPIAIEKCNWLIAQSVFKKHGMKLNALPSFRGLLRRDRVMSPKEVEDYLMQAGAEHQKSLGI